MGRDDGDRPRRSWRDIDRKKDSSSHIDQSDPYRKKGRRGGRAEGGGAGYKSALDRFFDGGELPDRYQKLTSAKDKLASGPKSPRQTALKKLRDAVGRSDVVAAVEELIKLDGELPRDADALLAALLHPDEDRQREAMTLLRELAQDRPLKRKDMLRQRLRQVADLAEESETAELAQQLIRSIT
jgi:hypothetical protein